MLSFLLDEGVVTVGVLSGLFTTGLLNSFKLNILDPTIEKMIPSHTLDNFGNLFPVPVGTPEQTGLPKNVLKWQTFFKRFYYLVNCYVYFLFILEICFGSKKNE